MSINWYWFWDEAYADWFLTNVGWTPIFKSDRYRQIVISWILYETEET